jgi:signal transduction histidine kinase
LAHLSPQLQADVDHIGSITVVPTILDMICRTTGMGFAAVARVTDEKWIICSVKDEIQFGLLPGGELKLETTICHEIRQSGNGVIIDEVSKDPVFVNHHTPAMYGFQSYISIPIIRKDGTFFGTLCAIDPRPHVLNTPEVIGMFTLYADLISFHLNAIEQLGIAEQKLQDERRDAELREQFIAILGHDLRNPISAIMSSAQLLLKVSPDERTNRIAKIIQNSSYRMTGLIENVLDFARGRLGDGIGLKMTPDVGMEIVLDQVINELQIVWPNVTIETTYNLTQPVTADAKRMGQVLSNLLNNALTHGEASAPVKVYAGTDDGEFVLTVTNTGKKIPDAAMQHLFHPFSRGEIKPEQEGLGLGLYIVSEIAAAHKGKMEVASTDEETSFTLRMPVA